MKIQQIDNDILYLHNFIPEDLQKEFLEIIEDNKNFAWYYSESIVEGQPDTGGFSHIVIKDDIANSPYVNEFIKVFNLLEEGTGIQVQGVIRFRIRMTLADGTGPRNNYIHTDHTFPHKVLLIYINDTDGDTVLYDKMLGENISNIKEIYRFVPKIGDAIIFDGLRYHSGAVPSKGKRLVINIDFY